MSNMSKTTGHLSSVTSVDWHPHDKSICLTSSLDGSARLWNVDRGKTQFIMLTSDKVFQFQKVQFVRVRNSHPMLDRLPFRHNLEPYKYRRYKTPIVPFASSLLLLILLTTTTIIQLILPLIGFITFPFILLRSM